MVAIPRTPITTAQLALLANAGEPGGVATLDDDGALKGIFIVRFGTKAEMDLIVLQPGELGLCTDTAEIRMGNGTVAGGVPHTNTNPCAIVLVPTGSAVDNGTALRAAYAAAKLLTPNGAVLSATNRACVILLPGVYTITAAGSNLSLDTPYVDIIGLGGSQAVFINTDANNKVAITSANTNINLKGLRFASASTTSSLTAAWANGVTYVYNWEDLWLFTGSSSVICMTVTGANATITGSFRRCVTDGTAFMRSASAGNTFSADFIECEAGDLSFGGGSNTAFSAAVTGRILRCRNFGTTCNAKINGVFQGNDWGPYIVQCGSGLVALFNRIRSASSGHSIGNGGTSVTIKAAYNAMVGDIGNGCTNSLSGTLDGAGNFSDADVA